MADQTTLNAEDAARDGGKPRRLARNIARLVRDATHLAELQWELLREDSRQAVQRSRAPLIWTAVGVVLVAAAIPVLLLAFSWLLALAGLTIGLSMLIVALLAILVGLLSLYAAWSSVRSIAHCFEPTRRELEQNHRWLKSRLSDEFLSEET